MNKENLMSYMMRVVLGDKNLTALLETGRRMNLSLRQDDMPDFKIIIGVKDLNEIALLEAFQELVEDGVIFHKKQGLNMMNNHFGNVLRYIVILPDITKVDFTFMKNTDLQSYINIDSLCKVHIDKESSLVANAKITDAKYRQLKPTQKEFLQCCNEFFIKAVSITKAINRSDLFYASILFDKLRHELNLMTCYYIGSKYDFAVNIGPSFKSFKTYLEKDHYEKFMEVYPSPKAEELWTALFNACMLFRKAGLEVGDILSYDYPKRSDRDIVKFIRESWNSSIR